MALIDTGRPAVYLDTVDDLVQRLRDIIVEEMAAINTYAGMIRAVSLMGWAPWKESSEAPDPPMPAGRITVEDAKELSEFFTKIRDDEITHSGALLDLMQKLDKNTAAMMSKGINGV
jgi:hypothetical protein